jgi:hypothetical protein
MNMQFNIKFTIFDENQPLTKKQIQIRNNLSNDDMKQILKNAIIGLNDYKFLDRVEPSISSIDETKQLRLAWSQSDQYKYSLYFNQRHSCCKEYFSIEELKNISNRIKNELDEYLHYDIGMPILYIELDDL